MKDNIFTFMALTGKNFHQCQNLYKETYDCDKHRYGVNIEAEDWKEIDDGCEIFLK